MDYKKTNYYATDEGNVIVESKQDVSAIIESNKKQFNLYDENARWSESPFGNKIASIPMTVIDMLNQKKIMRGFSVIDKKKFSQWLNDKDNRFFRTRTGKV
jgi:hypothetical protein